MSPRAEVAELADALDSGSSARKGVRVQIPASAPPSTSIEILEGWQGKQMMRVHPFDKLQGRLLCLHSSVI